MNSEASIFENAQCIWESDSMQVNQYALFEQKFPLAAVSDEILLRISVDNRYQLWINGKMFPHAQAYTDYPFYKTYDEIVLPKEFLTAGENTMEILVYCPVEESMTYYPGTPGVIFEILEYEQVITYSHVEKTVAYHVTGYQCGPMEKFSPQLAFAFAYDATVARDEGHRPIHGKRAEKYYKRPIPQLVVSSREDVRIQSQGIFAESLNRRENGTVRGMGDRMQNTALQYVGLLDMTGTRDKLLKEEGLVFATAENCDGIYIVLDLQKEMAGYLELDFELEEDTDVLIGYGEHLDDLRVRTSVGGRQFAARYRGRKGCNHFMYTIKRIAGRYLQLHFYTRNVRLHYAGIRSVDYPVQRKEQDLELNLLQKNIFETSINTLKRCMHEHYEDCPWREQALYAMDSRNQILCGYEVFGETTLPKASLRLLGTYTRKDGFFELTAPAQNTPTIAAFNLIWLVELFEYYRYTNDLEFIKEMLPKAQNLMEVILAHVQDGLLPNLRECWNFYEWTEGMGKRPVEGFDAPLNAFFGMALLSMTELMQAVGNPFYAKRLQHTYEILKKRYHEVFYCEEKNAYRLSLREEENAVFPELAQALSVVAGLCETKEIEEALCERLLTDAFCPRVSLSHVTFAYEALMKMEERHPDGRNVKRIIEDIDRKWSKMLFEGATTFWETEEGADAFKEAGSLCHGWSATPAYFYSKLLKKKSY